MEGDDKKVGDRTCKKLKNPGHLNKNSEANNRNRRCSFVMAINGTCEVYDISLLERMVNCRVVGAREVDFLFARHLMAGNAA